MRKVAIVGVEGSGKTVMLAGLGDLYTYPDEEGYFLSPKNFGTAAYVAEKIERMRKGEWPSATADDVMEGLDWTLRRRKPGSRGRPDDICEVSFLDFAGEVYRTAFGIGAGDVSLAEQAEELKRYVSQADDLIVLINLRDVITNGLCDKRVQESMWITNAILDAALAEDAGRKAPHAAIVLSQADSYADTIEACGGAAGVLQKYLPHVANNYGWLDVFAASAVDKTRLDDDGNVVPAPDFQSEGLRSAVGWILDEIDADDDEADEDEEEEDEDEGEDEEYEEDEDEDEEEEEEDEEDEDEDEEEEEEDEEDEDEDDLVDDDDNEQSEEEWTPGARNPRWPHVVAAEKEGVWHPEAGYRWVNPKDNADMSVKWTPGARDSRWPHVVAAEKEGEWHPEAGYRWVNPKDNADMSVKWVPGTRNSRWSHVVATEKEGEWHPEAGYRWVNPKDNADMSVKWTPGVRDPRWPHVVSSEKEGSWHPETGYVWLNPNDNTDKSVKKKAETVTIHVSTDHNEDANFAPVQKGALWARRNASSTVTLSNVEWKVKAGCGSIRYGKIVNQSAWDTGSLKLCLWLSGGPYQGGTLSGTEIGECIISTQPLRKGYQFSDSEVVFSALCNPASGDYESIVTVNEYHESGNWYIVGWINLGVTHWNH